MTYGEKAYALFDKGYNCSQSVAGAFADVLGLDEGTVCMMVSGFGGGFGRLREVCGAVSGMTFVAGCLTGYGVPDDEKKAELYAFVQSLANKFKAHNGTIICRELLGLDANAPTPSVPEKRTPKYYATRPCGQFVADAADILAAALTERNIIK